MDQQAEKGVNALGWIINSIAKETFFLPTSGGNKTLKIQAT